MTKNKKIRKFDEGDVIIISLIIIIMILFTIVSIYLFSISKIYLFIVFTLTIFSIFGVNMLIYFIFLRKNDFFKKNK